MAISITIPTPPGGGQPVRVAVGKVGMQFPNAAEAVEWARAKTQDMEILLAIAIRLAADRPATRGLTLTFDATSNNILAVT